MQESSQCKQPDFAKMWLTVSVNKVNKVPSLGR